MNSKIVLMSSSLFQFVIGTLLTFLPEESNSVLHIEPNEWSTIVFQLLGALYVGSAVNNWMAKGARMGGIYQRPLCMGNFAHFLIGGMALIKLVTTNQHWLLLVLSIGYTIFGLSFAYLFMNHPKEVQ